MIRFEFLGGHEANHNQEIVSVISFGILHTVCDVDNLLNLVFLFIIRNVYCEQHFVMDRLCEFFLFVAEDCGMATLESRFFV